MAKMLRSRDAYTEALTSWPQDTHPSANTQLPASCPPPCQAFCVKQQPTFHCRGSGEWNSGIMEYNPHCTQLLFIISILCEFASWMQNDNFADITSKLHKNSNVTQQWLRLWKLFLCKNCKRSARISQSRAGKAATWAFSRQRRIYKTLLCMLKRHTVSKHTIGACRGLLRDCEIFTDLRCQL